MTFISSRKLPYVACLFFVIVASVYFGMPHLLEPDNISYDSNRNSDANKVDVIRSASLSLDVSAPSAKQSFNKYAAYDIPGLLKLINSGDVDANYELAIRLNVEIRDPSQHKAVVYGKFSGTKAQMEELNTWRSERGYMLGPEGSNVYESYNHETLRKLVANGDMYAMEALANNYLDDEYRKENNLDLIAVMKDRLGLLYNAAVHGSTSSLNDLAISISNKSAADGIVDFKQKEIEKYAWFAVAAKRGDVMQLYSSSKSLRVPFTETDWNLVAQKADQMYRELEQHRISAGLGSFDNSVPETVKDFFDEIYPRPKELPKTLP
ncbi:MAG TPA: hypothetical protein PK002_03635 [Cellvibrio sp.]|nr:hypothetical protein [Cellvibrio sp.]